MGQTYHRLENVFGQTMELLGDVGQMEARFGLFREANGDTRYRTICGEHVIVKEIVLGLPDGTPRWHGSSGSSLQFAWRLVNLAVR
jgi:hypothetical protein